MKLTHDNEDVSLSKAAPFLLRESRVFSNWVARRGGDSQPQNPPTVLRRMEVRASFQSPNLNLPPWVLGCRPCAPLGGRGESKCSALRRTASGGEGLCPSLLPPACREGKADGERRGKEEAIWTSAAFGRRPLCPQQAMEGDSGPPAFFVKKEREKADWPLPTETHVQGVPAPAWGPEGRPSTELSSLPSGNPEESQGPLGQSSRRGLLGRTPGLQVQRLPKGPPLAEPASLGWQQPECVEQGC